MGRVRGVLLSQLREVDGVIAQIAIAVFGVSAVWLSQDHRPHWRRWAPIMGLAGQPAWLYATYTAEQWGIFALCGVYTAAWARGFHNHWIKGA